MLDDIIKRLKSFGCKYDELTDRWLIDFLIAKNTNYINNQCNTGLLPLGLYEVAVDKVVGEFMFSQYTSGKLSIDTIDLDLIAKKIQEGDTTVEFAVGKDMGSTPEVRLKTLIDWLMHNDANYARYRVLLW